MNLKKYVTVRDLSGMTISRETLDDPDNLVLEFPRLRTTRRDA